MSVAESAIRAPRRSISNHAPTLGLDQSDQSSAIVAKVPAILRARTTTRRGEGVADRGARARVPRASSWTLISTRTPRMPQNRASGTLKPQVPRSQNDW